MDILMVGGTAFFGRDLVELALEAGHRVTIFSRGNQKPTFWDHIKHIAGDRHNQADVTTKLKGLRFDVVVDNIAYNATDVRNTLEALEGNVGRYVLTSTAGVYIGMGCFDMPFSEDTRIEVKRPRFSGHPTPADDEFINYVTGKLEAEKVIVEQDKVLYTIVRPSSTAGPNDPSGRCQFYFRRLLDGNPLILTNGGVHVHNMAYRRDVARGYLAAMSSKKAVNQIYNFAQDEMFRVLDWVSLAADLLEVEADIVSISAESLQQSGFVYSEPWSFTGNFILDVSRAQTDLGYQSTPVETWMTVTTEWYREKGEWKNSLEESERQEEIAFIQRYRRLIAQL
jgi:nucleoside-diphosphate-sugar epimerase